MHSPGLFEVDQIFSQTDESKAVDDLLSKELLELSLKDRNAIQEEIHGVRCLAPEETPELLRFSLQRLALVLVDDEILPPHKKQAYLRSQELPHTYINGNDFRLRFLRLALFDVVQAAKRIVLFLEVGFLLFGDLLLQRPVRLSDFNKKELQYIRNGHIQFLPFRDRSGRRIVVTLNPCIWGEEDHQYWLNHTDLDSRVSVSR